MEIAIFGSTGWTGHPLIEQALERGHSVIAFARDATSVPSSFRDRDRVSVVEGDAYSGESVAEFILNCIEEDRYVHEMPKIADK